MAPDFGGRFSRNFQTSTGPVSRWSELDLSSLELLPGPTRNIEESLQDVIARYKQFFGGAMAEGDGFLPGAANAFLDGSGRQFLKEMFSKKMSPGTKVVGTGLLPECSFKIHGFSSTRNGPDWSSSTAYHGLLEIVNPKEGFVFIDAMYRSKVRSIPRYYTAEHAVCTLVEGEIGKKPRVVTLYSKAAFEEVTSKAQKYFLALPRSVFDDVKEILIDTEVKTRKRRDLVITDWESKDPHGRDFIVSVYPLGDFHARLTHQKNGELAPIVLPYTRPKTVPSVS